MATVNKLLTAIYLQLLQARVTPRSYTALTSFTKTSLYVFYIFTAYSHQVGEQQNDIYI